MLYSHLAFFFQNDREKLLALFLEKSQFANDKKRLLPMKLQRVFAFVFICSFFFSYEISEAKFEFLEQIPNGHRLYSLNLSNCQVRL